MGRRPCKLGMRLMKQKQTNKQTCKEPMHWELGSLERSVRLINFQSNQPKESGGKESKLIKVELKKGDITAYTEKILEILQTYLKNLFHQTGKSKRNIWISRYISPSKVKSN